MVKPISSSPFLSPCRLISLKLKPSGAWPVRLRPGCSGRLPTGSSARPSAAPDRRPRQRYSHRKIVVSLCVMILVCSLASPDPLPTFSLACCGGGAQACRLRGRVRRAVRRAVAQEPVHPGVPQVLQRLPLRAGGHGRQPADVRQVLHRLDHARQQDQVPVTPAWGWQRQRVPRPKAA